MIEPKELSTSSVKRNFKSLLRNTVSDMNFSLSIALIIIFILLSFASPYFLTIRNLLTVGLHASIIGIMAIGLTIAMLMGLFDLSQYPVATIVSIVIGTLILNDVSPYIAIIIGLSAGLLCGSFNAFIINILRVNPIIATLATMLIFRGLCYIFTGTSTTMVSNPVLTFIGRGYVLKIIPFSLIVLVIMFLIAIYLLNITIFGKEVYAVGSESNSSYLAGIGVRKVRTVGLLISSLFASISGVLLLSQTGAVIPSSGVGNELDIVTAVLLGGLSLSGGKGKVSGTLLGLMIVVFVNNGLVLAGMPSYWHMFFRGVVLLFAVSIDSMRSRGRGYF